MCGRRPGGMDRGSGHSGQGQDAVSELSGMGAQ